MIELHLACSDAFPARGLQVLRKLQVHCKEEQEQHSLLLPLLLLQTL